MPVADPGSQPPCGGNIEAPARADSDPPNLYAGILPRLNHRPHQVARAETEPHLLARDVADGKAVLVGSAALPTPVACTGDQQHRGTRDLKQVGRTRSDARRVAPVRFLPP